VLFFFTWLTGKIQDIAVNNDPKWLNDVLGTGDNSIRLPPGLVTGAIYPDAPRQQ